MRPRILAIIPNENAGNMFLEVARTIGDIDLVVKHATLQDAVILANSVEKDFDVVIARGETARMIGRKTQIPVVELEIASHELLSAIRQAEALGQPFAIVGFPTLTGRAQRLSDLLGENLAIYTVFNNEDIDSVFDNIKATGVKVIVTGTGFGYYALSRDITIISIMTTMPSIEAVVVQAAELGRSVARNRVITQMLNELLSSGSERHIVIDKHNAVVFNNTSAPALGNVCRKLSPNKGAQKSVEKNIDGFIYKICENEFTIDNDSYIDFLITRRERSAVPQLGNLKIYNASEAEQSFLYHFPHFSDISFASSNQSEMERISSINTPVFLYGEKGTGKNQLAALIYLKSAYKSHMYYILDLSEVNDRQWSNFLSSADSPFAMSSITLYLKGLSKLGENRLNDLKDFIIESDLPSRIKLIFAYETLPNRTISAPVLSFMNQIEAISKQIKPLRERKNELAALTHIYINSYDENYCRSVIGLSPEAEALFYSYQWPGNLEQFKRVISELVLSSTSCYISEELVNKVLEREKKYLTSVSELSSVIDINKTMNEIEKDIAKAVLAKHNGSKSKTAEKLGISRTTLWRLLGD